MTSDVLLGLQIARVRLLFKLPVEIMPCESSPLLAFVDWFTPFKKYNKSLGMFQVSYARKQRYQHSGIVLAESILQTCHLIPEFGRSTVTNKSLWSSADVLDKCTSFFVNPYLRHYDFLLFRYRGYLYEQAELLRRDAQTQVEERPRKKRRKGNV
jgi:hypothetical protein